MIGDVGQDAADGGSDSPRWRVAGASTVAAAAMVLVIAMVVMAMVVAAQTVEAMRR